MNRERAVLRKAHKGLGARSPNVKGPKEPLDFLPTDADALLHIAAGGEPGEDTRGLELRYRTKAHVLLKVGSLIREHLPTGKTVVPFHQGRQALAKALRAFNDEDHATPAKVKRTLDIPKHKDTTAFHHVAWSPTREQLEEWKAEERRITRMPRQGSDGRRRTKNTGLRHVPGF